MTNNQKETYRESEDLSSRLPSRTEVHGQKNRKRKRKNSEEKKTSKQKKIKITIPLILLVVLLLLPGGYAIYLFSKEKDYHSDSANGVGEEISFAEDNSIEASIDHKDPSNSPVLDTDEKKEDENKEEKEESKTKTEVNKTDGENDEQKAEEQKVEN